MSYHEIWLSLSSYHKSPQTVISNYSQLENQSAPEIPEEKQ